MGFVKINLDNWIIKGEGNMSMKDMRQACRTTQLPSTSPILSRDSIHEKENRNLQEPTG